MATYQRNSPYFGTPNFGTFLDLLVKREFPFRADDAIYVIQQQYQYRPDLLAYDIYNNAGLWWVFATRNPNVLLDPIGDFVPGVSIRIPKQSDLVTALGL